MVVAVVLGAVVWGLSGGLLPLVVVGRRWLVPPPLVCLVLSPPLVASRWSIHRTVLGIHLATGAIATFAWSRTAGGVLPCGV